MFSDTNTGFTLLASLGAGQGQVLIPAVSLQDGEVKRKKEEEEGGGERSGGHQHEQVEIIAEG